MRSPPKNGEAKPTGAGVREAREQSHLPNWHDRLSARNRRNKANTAMMAVDRRLSEGNVGANKATELMQDPQKRANEPTPLWVEATAPVG
jgi:hypothetical protein